MRDEPRPTLARGAAFVAVVLGVIASWPALLLADVIWVGSGTGRGFRQEVDIVDVEGDQLIYLVNGNRGATVLERIQQIELAGESGFNQAEEAFASGDWEKSAANYLDVARRHSKTWVRRRAAERLITAAERAGRFDQAVTGFVQLTLIDPEAAVGREPIAPPEVAPQQLELAAGELQRSLDEGVSPAQSRPLLALLLQIHNRRGDERGAGETVERLARVMGDDAAGHDPELYAQVLLGRANLALSRGQIPEAVRLINEGRALFLEPRQQSDALMVLAQAAERLAGNDRAKLMDAAVAYMKVVTFFKRADGTPNVPDALWKVGQIHEKLALPEAAEDLYRDLVARYPDSRPAVEAQKRLDTLGH